MVNLKASLWRGRKIGLLGGSFNPAHQGHLMISHQALLHLKLDEVWWLVSPQNPLKSATGMATEESRLKAAHFVARDRRIKPMLLESALGTQYTADTLATLTQECHSAHFVWLMGADNLVQFPRWRNWENILHTVPIAVFGRPHYSLGAMTSIVAKRYSAYRVQASAASKLARAKAPAWTFIHYRHDPISATQLREARPASATPAP
jgi:nicotinate-nucleotide adenylyltransferase